jgi:hypothetical protein
MAEDPVPVGPPRLPLPERSERSRAPLLAAFVLLSIVAVVLGVMAVAALLREPADLAAPPLPASTSATATPSSVSEPAVQPKVKGGFRFIERAANGDPVRWDPCETITYAINASGISPPIQPDLKEALARVTDVTGIDFEPVGTTRENFFSAYRRMRYRGVIREAELILIWVDHEGYDAILRRLNDPRPSIAFAKTMVGLYADRDQYFGGIIVLDADATARRGFGDTYAHGSVLLHELGHALGLDHVKDPHQLMYSGRRPDLGLTGFAPGDLEGLRRLGEDAGCLD